jgi:hypothetical protein
MTKHYCGTGQFPHEPGEGCSEFATPAPTVVAERVYAFTRDQLIDAIAGITVRPVRLSERDKRYLATADDMADLIISQHRVTHYHHPPACGRALGDGEMWSGRDDNVTCLDCLRAPAVVVGGRGAADGELPDSEPAEIASRSAADAFEREAGFRPPGAPSLADALKASLTDARASRGAADGGEYAVERHGLAMREAAADMRARHGDGHPRQAFWAALAAWLESVWYRACEGPDRHDNEPESEDWNAAIDVTREYLAGRGAADGETT